jgi:hypothetical protein
MAAIGKTQQVTGIRIQGKYDAAYEPNMYKFPNINWIIDLKFPLPYRTRGF